MQYVFFFIALIMMYFVFGGDQVDVSPQKEQSCQQACQTLNKCHARSSLHGVDMSLPNCIERCRNTPDEQWARCTLSRHDEYGCCVDALSDCTTSHMKQ